MDYKECVEWLYKCMPPFQMVGRSGYKPGMESMRLLDAFLGSPHKNSLLNFGHQLKYNQA